MLGDCVLLCDGTVLCTGGAQKGTAGWGSTPRKYTYRDGKSEWGRGNAARRGALPGWTGG